MPPDAVPPQRIKVELKLWPTHEEEAAIRALLQETYGPGYDPIEADALMAMAEQCFDQTDALHEWPDIELWRLFCEAQNRVEWLQQLFSGQTPDGWKPPKAVVQPDHIRGERRWAMGLDDPDWGPSSYNPRLTAVLADSETLGPSGVDALNHAQAYLSAMQALLASVTERIEPERQAMTGAEIKAASKKRYKRAGEWAALRRQRPLTKIEKIQQRVDAMGLEFFNRPFRRGRREAPAPLVAFVEALAASWQRALETPPPVVRPPSTSAAADRFASLLRLFESAYRRKTGELGRAVVDAGIARLKGRSTRSL